MAAVLSPSYAPRQGILLNRSPSVSPYHHSASLPPLVPSNSSLSSSTSSASNLNTSDSDYTTSSTSASPSHGSRPLHTHKHLQQKPRSGSTPTSRRIRFAPLPDPRRDVFITDGDEGALLPSVFLDDADDPKSSQNYAASSAGKPNSLSLKDQATKLKAAPPSSLLFSGDPSLRLQASESTPTLASTVTITSNPNPGSSAAVALVNSMPSNLDGGDWNVLDTASPRPASVNLPDDPPSRCNSVRGSRWSKKLLKPLLGPLSSSSKNANRSSDDLRSSASVTSLNSTLTLPASPGVDGCSIGLGSGSKGSDKEKPKKKKRDKGPESDWVREFGMPLYRWSSEGDPMGIPLNKKGRPMTMSELSEAGPEFWKKHEAERRRARSGSGTKMLNGRVYGAKRNAFANIRSEEPEFVEWGFGGMGSVQKGGVGAGIWAKVQAPTGVSVGAHDGDSRQKTKTEKNTSRASTRSGDRDDDDDGSGMSWVKRRRELREKEQREREAKEREQKNKPGAESHVPEGQPNDLAVAESPPAMEPHSSVSDPDPPQKDAAERPTIERALSSSPTSMTAPLPEVSTPSTEEKHLLTAVKLPPEFHHHHHHHHSHSHGHSHSRSTIERYPSAVRTEPERRDSADTARGVPASSDRLHVASDQALGPGEVDEEAEAAGRQRKESVSSEMSALSTTSSSSTSDEVDDAAGDDEDGEPDSPREVDDEEDEELEERSRITALSAGVEKVSRHRESTPVQDADLE